MSMRNILIVGAKGLIGSALFTHFQSVTDVNVWGTLHRQTSPESNIFYLNLLEPPSAWHLPDIQFDVVYLCAGICRMPLCEADPATTHTVNVRHTYALVSQLAATGAYIVYLSTNQVFSGLVPYALATTACDPHQEYGRQKAEMEDLIKTHCAQWAIVRLTKVIEPNMPLFNNWMNQLVQGQSVEAFHDMMFAPVTLSQVVRVLVKLGINKQVGIFQVSGAEDISYYTAACVLARQLGRPASLVQSVSALDRGIKKSFIPPFTTLECSSTIAVCGERPQSFAQVLHYVIPHFSG